MKYIIFSILTIMLFSCKTQKAGCDAYSINNRVDTIYITPNHYHIESQYKCVWIDTTTRK